MESITGHIPMVFIGNKEDLTDQSVVTRQDIEKIATSYGSPAIKRPDGGSIRRIEVNLYFFIFVQSAEMPTA